MGAYTCTTRGQILKFQYCLRKYHVLSEQEIPLSQKDGRIKTSIPLMLSNQPLKISSRGKLISKRILFKPRYTMYTTKSENEVDIDQSTPT